MWDDIVAFFNLLLLVAFVSGSGWCVHRCYTYVPPKCVEYQQYNCQRCTEPYGHRCDAYEQTTCQRCVKYDK